MNHNQDQHYIAKVIQGDIRAFSVLIDRYKYMVFTMALKIVRNREDAEEVAQDVFIKAFSALDTFKGDSKFSTWLYQIAYYRSLDYLKKSKRSVETTGIDVSDDYSITNAEYITDYLEANDRKTMIKKALDELSADDSLLITLHYFEELSLKEISKVMDITANTAKVRLFRSRKRLAEILKDRVEPEVVKNHGRK